MKLSPDDPKLTAYALGELPDHECAAVEAALAESPECLKAVEAIQTFAGQLTGELQQESAAALTPEQVQAVIQAGPDKDKIIPLFGDKRTSRTIWMIAAGFVLMLTLSSLFLPSLTKAKRESTPERVMMYAAPSASAPPSAIMDFYRESSEPARYIIPQNTITPSATYQHYIENPFIPVAQEALSTFSTDVDTASYAIIRQFLNRNMLPPPDAVRIEEMLNYFTYHYPQPEGNVPFSVNMESASCPWNSEHRLLRVGLKGREMPQDKRPASNFVFLIDVSGSMSPADRLPLIKQSLRQLVKKMTEKDRVAMVVYASSSGVVLPSTSCANKEQVLEAIDRLEAGGSTNGGDGIQRAYSLAAENFIPGGVNRVILCTDGDFNVGITDRNELIRLIESKAKSGVFLTTLGVGMDNLQDATLQQLADKGNGNYHHLDSLEEGHKVLIEQMNSTLVTIAKDVKVQIEFNPAQVQAYRLIGYEKRMLRKEDFNNDAKDAGEIGAGHTVTALYEIVPIGAKPVDNVDPLKYQAPAPPAKANTDGSKELCTVKLRYKQPEGDNSKLIAVPYVDSGASYGKASQDFKFAASVAVFGQILKGSTYTSNSSLDAVLELATEAKGEDAEGYRAEFLNLVKKAKELKR